MIKREFSTLIPLAIKKPIRNLYLRCQHNRYRPILKKLKNVHEGKRCFVVGNGPSLNEMDLSKLKKEVTIGSNRIYLSDKLIPQYYCLEDALLMEQIFKGLEDWRAKDTMKFIPTLLSGYTKKIKNVCLVNFVYTEYEGREPNFSEDISEICYWGSTVTYMMLQVAYFLGCNPIYLIGMDGVRPNKSKHFYKKDPVEENPPRYGLSDTALIKARKFLESKGAEIYNATKNPVRNFFKKTKYEDIFK